jgi:hypothetical protein
MQASSSKVKKALGFRAVLVTTGGGTQYQPHLSSPLIRGADRAGRKLVAVLSSSTHFRLQND